IKASDVYNWTRKIEVNASRFMDLFNDYPGGYEAFIDEFNKYLIDPRRFTYTPLILCKGIKPKDISA
ncbi:MAG: hypothetical protein Q7U40_02885, partial [Desulfatirhabdiaceae bacterium]|nr:hypothetical protein [Desulfatirhabdiaceae bacterium]